VNLVEVRKNDNVVYSSKAFLSSDLVTQFLFKSVNRRSTRCNLKWRSFSTPPPPQM